MAPALEAIGQKSVQDFVTHLEIHPAFPDISEALGRLPADSKIHSLSILGPAQGVETLQALSRSPIAANLTELQIPVADATQARNFFLTNKARFPRLLRPPRGVPVTKQEWRLGRATLGGECLRRLSAIGRALVPTLESLVR